jgi:rhodanese-related sulfurtransferase
VQLVPVPEVAITELTSALDAGAVLIDVRQPHEYAKFHVPGARLIPLNELPNRSSEIPRGQRVYLICQTGSRSAKAAEWLNGRGFDTVNVAGGSKAWAEAGHPIEQPSETPGNG